MVAANRDEFHARPTAPAQFWDGQPDLLAGRDLQQGGTWMGITRRGRFAAVTNYRDPAGPFEAPRSRGDLPLDFLAGTQSPAKFLQDVANRATDYAGFNLLVGDRDSLWYFANSDAVAPRELSPGLYGLSNARLDTPWPKVMLGKEKFRTLNETDGINHDTLAALVANQQSADPRELEPLGLNGAMDPLLSAQFIVTEAYGTRSRTTLWLDADGRAHWREQSFSPEGALREVRTEAFTLAEG